MDPSAAAAWEPYEFHQLANWWSVEEPAAAVFPLEYTSIDIFDTSWGLQAPVPEPIEGQQIVELYYNSAEEPKSTRNIRITEADSSSEDSDDGDGDDEDTLITDRKEASDSSPEVSEEGSGDETEKVEANISRHRWVSKALEQVAREFDADIKLMKEKMHRYPACLRDTIDKQYRVPRIVAIGPYHHDKDHLKAVEKVKHMAAIGCVAESSSLLEEMYPKVASVADSVRHLYDKDVMERIFF